MIDSRPTDGPIDVQIAIVRSSMPLWIQETADLAELAANAERAGTQAIEDTINRSGRLIVEVAVWQQKLGEWQGPRAPFVTAAVAEFAIESPGRSNSLALAKAVAAIIAGPG